MDWRVPLADLDYGPDEENAVLDVLQRRWLTMGEVTQTFEKEFAAYVGAKHALAVSNATVALHLACLSLGIGPGDEVIVPSLTFVATANAVLYTGARVRFADILGPDDLNISPDSIEALITPRTKAMIVMHYGGYPCQMEELIGIADKHHLAVIEDAAHAPGSWLNGRHLGTWGDAGCFSFFSNKNLSTGEGGMLVTNRDDVDEKVRLVRSHGMTTLTWDRHQGHAYSYDVVDLGYNYRIDEMRSALGLVQLHKLDASNQRRGELTQKYWEAFQNQKIRLPFKEARGRFAHHLFPILLPEEIDRNTFIDQLRALGIQTSIHYPPVHKFSYYQQHYPGVILPITEEMASLEVTLPLYAALQNEDVDFVIQSVLDTLENLC
jgi:dTDP-4-amino-4,6-dideoxygalactose transaminase